MTNLKKEKKEELIKCCLCKQEIEVTSYGWGGGNNPAPFGDKEDRCCQSCDEDIVLPWRLRQSIIAGGHYDMAEHMLIHIYRDLIIGLGGKYYDYRINPKTGEVTVLKNKIWGDDQFAQEIISHLLSDLFLKNCEFWNYWCKKYEEGERPWTVTNIDEYKSKNPSKDDRKFTDGMIGNDPYKLMDLHKNTPGLMKKQNITDFFPQNGKSMEE